MAYIVRYRKTAKDEWDRVRTKKYANGYFPTQAEANAALATIRRKGWAGHTKFASVPVPRPPVVVNFKSASHGTNKQKVIVLHSTESTDRPQDTTDVMGVLGYLKNEGLGVHYVIDGDGNLGIGADHRDLVYHASGANSLGIGIEQIGKASWTAAQWRKYPNGKARKQLDRVAWLIAYISDVEKIPLVLSTTHGVATHAMFPKGGHHDPGKGYPLGYVMAEARRIKKMWRG